VINTNLRPILHSAASLHHFGSKLRRLLVKFSLATGGRITLTPSLGWSPANIRITFTSPQKLEWLSYLMLKTARSCGQNTGTCRTDRQMDRKPVA